MQFPGPDPLTCECGRPGARIYQDEAWVYLPECKLCIEWCVCCQEYILSGVMERICYSLQLTNFSERIGLCIMCANFDDKFLSKLSEKQKRQEHMLKWARTFSSCPVIDGFERIIEIFVETAFTAEPPERILQIGYILSRVKMYLSRANYKHAQRLVKEIRKKGLGDDRDANFMIFLAKHVHRNINKR